MVRARQSRRDDRLFDDPYAQAFVDAVPGAFPEEPKTGKELAALGPDGSRGQETLACSRSTFAARRAGLQDRVLATQDAVPGCTATSVPTDLRTDWTAAPQAP